VLIYVGVLPFGLNGGERGIRTLETLLTLTHFPGVLLQPLGHLTVNCCRFSVLETIQEHGVLVASSHTKACLLSLRDRPMGA
jgi:hypothetical protein